MGEICDRWPHLAHSTTVMPRSEPVRMTQPHHDPNAETRRAPEPNGTGTSETRIPADVLPADVQYRLLRRIGKGSFGEVFEAEAPGGFRVAVKRLHRDADHPASQGELEALETIKALTHPFLLQTHAYWFFGNQLVIAMEMADGSLADWIKDSAREGQAGVPVERLIPFFEQAAAALDYLHGERVSHRDIKPQNLLHLKGYAKVADFGLARLQTGQETMIHQEQGTPLYMAPEVWKKVVSLHSDQYSFAATYVEARLGRAMFESENLGNLVHKHLHVKPDLSSLPESEQQVLHRALAKKPEERFPTCTAFVAALRQAVMPAPTPAPPPLEPPWRRALTATLTVGVVILPLMVWWWLRPAPSQTWCPADWEPRAGAELIALPDGRTVPREVQRTVAGENLTALLIAPSQPEDPPAYYMLREKISNRVFSHVWDAHVADQGSRLARYLHQASESFRHRCLPTKWREGALDRLGRPLGTVHAQADLPVVRLTAVEAALAARELGGRLPNFAQWLKAVGVRDDLGRQSPAGDPAAGEAFPRGMALGLTDGPWPVHAQTPDVSVHGIHQLVSNGLEWTRTFSDDNRRELDIDDLPQLPAEVWIVGQAWDLRTLITYARLRDGEFRRPLKFDDTSKEIGFRIVLEVPPAGP